MEGFSINDAEPSGPATIIRRKNCQQAAETTLLLASCEFHSLFSILKMEAVIYSETSVIICRTRRGHSPEYSTLQL
jgi:hypothetical protein